MIALAELKAWLSEPSEPGVDDILTALEPQAVIVVERETGRYFGASITHTEIVVGDGTGTLRLAERPNTITSVEERRRAGDTWTEIVETADDGFESRIPSAAPARTKLIRKNGRIWRSGWEYRVIYDFGYAAGAEPGDIRLAVKQVVALLYAERGREGLRTESVGDHSYSVLTNASGRRELASVPGLTETLADWRGAVLA